LFTPGENYVIFHGWGGFHVGTRLLRTLSGYRRGVGKVGTLCTEGTPIMRGGSFLQGAFPWTRCGYGRLGKVKCNSFLFGWFRDDILQLRGKGDRRSFTPLQKCVESSDTTDCWSFSSTIVSSTSSKSNSASVTRVLILLRGSKGRVSGRRVSFRDLSFGVGVGVLHRSFSPCQELHFLQNVLLPPSRLKVGYVLRPDSLQLEVVPPLNRSYISMARD
jgi:hypothetical protein